MKVFLVSTNESAWLVSANHASTAMFRVINIGALDGDGTLQVTARETSESAWMALVSSTVAGRLRRLIGQPLQTCGTHEGLLDVMVEASTAFVVAQETLNEAKVIYHRAAGADIVCVQTILEAE